MSRKEEILRRAKEMARQERERKKATDRPYDGRGMISRMPAGCWLWLIILVVLTVYGFTKLLHGVQ